ncbi:TM2 domain-containing protein [Psychroserpens luteolus]|uniref:TM2 domain-containing protein n=1 Tax=Psychroserpens luteolus TaxID=2855840 RepID=UPI001E3063C7|nr:TM2 domain-containing protein [Psychroserpens luteolus]MCD2257950.1 TM2 domain-containing protein [Psychroserpens luteolus]
MKFKIILSLLALMLTVNLSYASFPVVKAKTTSAEVVTTVDTEDNGTFYSPAAKAAQKSQGVALLLWFFLGGLAGHRWYLGSPVGWNILFILTLGGLGIWAIVDLIGIITGSYEPKNGSYKSSFF